MQFLIPEQYPRIISICIHHDQLNLIYKVANYVNYTPGEEKADKHRPIVNPLGDEREVISCEALRLAICLIKAPKQIL
jgi:hypothetical protein